MSRTEAHVSFDSSRASYSASRVSSQTDAFTMAAAQEARETLSHLLAKLQDPESKYYKRYSDWIKRSHNLEESLFRCLRPEVLTYLQLGSGNVNSIKNIGGDMSPDGPAVYVHGIWGLDRRCRQYIGQSNHLNTRIKQHLNFRYRRENPSLHYHAMQNSSFDAFAVLIALPSPNTPGYHNLPGMDQPDLLLNVLEMWSCLLFRSLPRQTLETFLPRRLSAKSKEGGSIGALNIATPLDHGEKGAREWIDLSGSPDPLIQDFLKAGEEKRSAVESTSVRKPDVSPAMTVLLVGAAVFLTYQILKGGSGSAARPGARWR